MDVVETVLQTVQKGELTQIYAAHDAEHNGSLVLKKFLEHRLARGKHIAAAARRR